MLHDLAKTREHFELLRKLTGTGQNPVPRSPDSARWALRVPPVEQLHQRLRALPAFSRRPEPSGVHRAANCARRTSVLHERPRSFTAMDSRHPEHFPVLTERLRTLTERPRTFTGTSGFHRALRRSPAGPHPSHRASAHPHDLQPSESSALHRPWLWPPGVLGRHRNLRVPPSPSEGSTKPLAPYVAAPQR
jgi:hypothetical protein